jgi:hypothetical protein
MVFHRFAKPATFGLCAFESRPLRQVRSGVVDARKCEATVRPAGAARRLNRKRDIQSKALGKGVQTEPVVGGVGACLLTGGDSDLHVGSALTAEGPLIDSVLGVMRIRLAASACRAECPSDTFRVRISGLPLEFASVTGTGIPPMLKTSGFGVRSSALALRAATRIGLSARLKSECFAVRIRGGPLNAKRAPVSRGSSIF